VHGLFTASNFLVVDAPGGPGLFEFLKSRLDPLGVKPAPTVVLLTSCDLAATAGLKDLVEKCHPLVVAPRAGLKNIEESCPAGTIVVSAEELPQKDWFKVTPIPHSGRGVAPIAYQVQWANKNVLFSGRIPIKVNQETGVALFSDFMSLRGDAAHYLTCLTQLATLKPDLWLPAITTEGQNANLYERQWDQVLEEMSCLTVGSNSSFGGNCLVETIGLLDATQVAELTVSWPTSQITQTFHDVGADQAIEITEGSDSFEVRYQPKLRIPHR
jgi:hypothetical protein